jgi:anti-sigma B factor antagonist
MDLNPRSIGDVLVLAPAGRLDHESVDAFRSGLQPQLDAAFAAGRSVLFDLSALEYISSAGLRCFMLAARQASARNGKMAVAGARPVVAEIFEISRFNMVFRVFPAVREGLGYLSPDAAASPGRG